MSLKTKILLVSAIVTMCLMLLFIAFGENGLSDLYRIKKQKENLAQKNDALKKENITYYREIERLKHDPGYVEEVARKELGVIGKDEVIIKVKPKPKPRVSNKDRKAENKGQFPN